MLGFRKLTPREYRFDLVVRFRPDRLRSWSGECPNVFYRDADELEPGTEQLSVDNVW